MQNRRENLNEEEGDPDVEIEGEDGVEDIEEEPDARSFFRRMIDKVNIFDYFNITSFIGKVFGLFSLTNIIFVIKLLLRNCVRVTLFLLIAVPIYITTFLYLLHTVFTYNPDPMLVQKGLLFNYQEAHPTTQMIRFDPPQNKRVFIREIDFEIEVPKIKDMYNLGRFMVNAEFYNEFNEKIHTLIYPAFISQSQGLLFGMLKNLILFPLDLLGMRSRKIYYKLHLLDQADDEEIEVLNEILKQAVKFRVRITVREIVIAGSRIKFISSIRGWRFYVFYHPYLSFVVLLAFVWTIVTAISSFMFCGCCFYICYKKTKKE